jgi:hypothetical protein
VSFQVITNIHDRFSVGNRPRYAVNMIYSQRSWLLTKSVLAFSVSTEVLSD